LVARVRAGHERKVAVDGRPAAEAGFEATVAHELLRGRGRRADRHDGCDQNEKGAKGSGAKQEGRLFLVFTLGILAVCE
jgi:antitoxin (DNA-binding transcriptional repressor) of toxin-antitoxin stability system